MTFFGLKDYEHKPNPVNTGKRGSDKIAPQSLTAERKWVLLSWWDFRHFKPFHSDLVEKKTRYMPAYVAAYWEKLCSWSRI